MNIRYKEDKINNKERLDKNKLKVYHNKAKEYTLALTVDAKEYILPSKRLENSKKSNVDRSGNEK